MWNESWISRKKLFTSIQLLCNVIPYLPINIFSMFIMQVVIFNDISLFDKFTSFKKRYLTFFVKKYGVYKNQCACVWLIIISYKYLFVVSVKRQLPVSICKKKVLKSCHVNSELEIFTMRTKILQCLSPIFGLFRYSLANDRKKFYTSIISWPHGFPIV